MALGIEKTTVKSGKSSTSGMSVLKDSSIKMSYSQIIQQKFEAKNITIINQRSGSQSAVRAPQSLTLTKQESQINEFSSAVRQFKSGHFILVTCSIDHSTDVPSIQSIGHVPWVAVFDFDQNSRSDGLLSQTEIPIMGKRSLHIKTWQDKVVINEESTNWILIKGRNDQPETLTDDKFHRWKNKTKSGLDHIMEQMKKFGGTYAKYYVVVLWPSNERLISHVKHLLDELAVLDLCNFVIVIDKKEEPTEITENVLAEMQNEYEREPTIVWMPITDVCLAIERVFRHNNLHKPTKFDLPTSYHIPIGIEDRDAQWLKEDLEVLYLRSPYDYEKTHEKLQEEKRQFYMGGNWPWCMWYAFGGNFVDIERDIMNDIKDALIENHVEAFKSGRVTIFHAPGSGGTTLAQRIFWDLHQKTPCVHVKLRTGSAEVASRLQFIYDKTRLPILILLDGEDEQRVDLLVQELKEICYVILHVKRYPYPMTSSNKDSKKKCFWLTRYVSKEEAVTLADKFIQQCDTQDKRDQVECLQHDVETEKSSHEIFEFGLATYQYQYKGIESYVNGFLQLDSTPEDTLEPWQNALGILSLVYYYGQMAIPCKFFEKVLKYDPILSFDDFPLEMDGLLMRDTNDGRANVVRVSHYLVAKEILEQILSRPLSRGDRVQGLCVTAARKLEPYACNFIQLAANTTTEKSGIMEKIMKNTFISRNNKYVGETDIVDKPGKPKFAQILHDVSSRTPFTARFQILKMLTKSFPREPQFLAHLGRLYSLCRPEKEEKAEDCFKKALDMCEKEKGDLGKDELPNNLRHALMHIYHMYGYMFLESVSNYTGKFPGDQPKKNVKEDTAEQVLHTIFPKVEAASIYFTQCREVTPEGSEESYGFLGEIKIRLMFCDFVNRHIADGKLYKFISSKEYSEIATFVEDTISVVDDLVLECLSVVDPDKTEKELGYLQKWFAGLFKIRNVGNVVFRTSDEVKSKRLFITATKLIYQKQKVFGVLEEVTSSVHIEEIVKHYEAIFKDVHENGIHSPRRLIDLDYREWVFAIRHTLLDIKYSLPGVLQHVELWHEKVNTPNSRFYLFILYSLIGFAGNSELLIKAQEVKQELLKQSKNVTKPRYPREWLGEGPGIRCLTPGTRFFGKIDGREIKGHFDSASLKHMFGTVCSPNEEAATGYIRLDLSKETPISITVFYVPVRSNMRGSAYVDRRVEFYLGFSMAHGYEAYNVRELQQIQCKKCPLYSWIRPNAKAKCKCGELLFLGT